MHRSPSSRALALALACSAPFASAIFGCGTGEYQQRMEARATELEFTGNFENNLLASTYDVNPECKLRLPAIFDSTSTGTPSGAPPSVCNIPGLSMTFEKFVAEGEKNFPFYCYFASTPVQEGQKAEDFKAAIEADIAKTGATGGKFAPISLSSPSGGAQNWDMLSVTSMQHFAGKQPGQDVTINGQFDLYFKSSGKSFILVGWRAPKDAAGASKFFADAKLAMGTAQVTESAPPQTPPGTGS